MTNKSTQPLLLAERRTHRYRRTFMGGLIVHADGQDFFRCTIRDLSGKGARVSLPKEAQMSDRIYLIHLHERTAYESEVLWFDGREAALMFRRKLPLGQLHQPELAYLKKVRGKWLRR